MEPTSPVLPPKRDRQPPHWMKDYICHSHYTPPSTPTTRPNPSSLGTWFPIANYVTYDIFSNDHRKFLASVIATMEPRSYK